MHCPVDGTGLELTCYEGVDVWTCPSCAGELVPGESLACIVNIREETFDPDSKRLLENAQPIYGVPASEGARSLACPACSSPMDVINYAGDSGVFVDRCPCCQGVWLDASELERVQILMERWEDEAPVELRRISGELEERRREAAGQIDGAFCGSRFSFVNALINRLLDAA